MAGLYEMNLKSKKTRNVFRMTLCFFYVLYISIHFFSNKMIARVTLIVFGVKKHCLKSSKVSKQSLKENGNIYFPSICHEIKWKKKSYLHNQNLVLLV